MHFNDLLLPDAIIVILKTPTDSHHPNHEEARLYDSRSRALPTRDKPRLACRENSKFIIITNMRRLQPNKTTDLNVCFRRAWSHCDLFLRLATANENLLAWSCSNFVFSKTHTTQYKSCWWWWFVCVKQPDPTLLPPFFMPSYY
jgi:hypothetical protein